MLTSIPKTALLSAFFLWFVPQTISAQGLDRVEKAIRDARNTNNDAAVNYWEEQAKDVTSVRNALREWVIRQLPPGIPDAQRDLTALAGLFNQQLKDAHIAEPADGGTGPFVNWAYEVGVELDRPENVPAYIELRLKVATDCGDDVTAYFLQWSGGAWQVRIPIDGSSIEGGFVASLDTVDFSDPDPEGNRILLALRSHVHCASNWNSFTFDIVRVHVDGTAEVLRSVSHEIYEGYDGPEPHYRLMPDSVLLEFADSSIDDGVHNRPFILHYQLVGNTLQRVDPIALRPFDFVDEWWNMDWDDALRWSAVGGSNKLQRFHETFRREAQRSGEFGFVQRCSNGSDWQVSYEAFDPKTVGFAAIYFLLRQTGQYQFIMLDVDTRRQIGCPGDALVDPDDRPSLFATRPERGQ